MVEDLFEGLPPPSSNPQEAQAREQEQQGGGARGVLQIPSSSPRKKDSAPSPVPAPPPALKSALKRPKSDEPTNPPGAESGKRLRFKTHTDASEAQVIDAMKKIASHIRNPTKLGKASKLAIQLIQAGSVKPGTRDYFFAILAAAMSSPTACTDQSVRSDYHALFSAAQDAAEHLSDEQKNQLTTWTIQAVVANDLFTDDSFVFSKTAGRIKDIISNLPVATEADDIEEAAALEAEKASTDLPGNQELPPDNRLGANNGEELDPFGLDALIPSKAKKEENPKGKKDAAAKIRKEEEDEHKRFLKSQREASIVCLEIAARRYKTPWCQTVIDILVKHAFDNVSRFTSKQREAITKLWASIREQQTRRKQGKSVSGKLDVNAFEWLQQKYATEKISIRHAVGGSGDRRAQQWLG
ncbi:uncharacterized protein LOC115744013 [Rhodamnia argentea]|uniref:Uncharacterized protein LOC115744013 n=1 Tax=Rhodamnia argentea TaxID=178133 RepID=A0A8B8PKN5_9MYRT|nr:uncharacterized protein LOC115744013 [Rhodamnia argentea]